MYEKESPVNDVHELVRFLGKKPNRGYLFRGQNRYREINAPSYMREALTGRQDEGWNELDPDYWKRASHRARAKSDLGIALLTYYGRGLGNILCQQYGVSSDA